MTALARQLVSCAHHIFITARVIEKALSLIFVPGGSGRVNSKAQFLPSCLQSAFARLRMAASVIIGILALHAFQ